MQTMTNTDQSPNTNTTDPTDQHRQRARIDRAMAKKSFATLSTVSAQGFPHAAGVLYVAVDGELWIHTMRTGRKARNVAATGRAGVVIPVRRLPVGPPFTIHFQADAEVVEMDDPRVTRLVEAKRLKKITSHGELDEPDGCFLRITPTRRIHSYGIGVSALAVARDPLHNGPRTVELG